MQLGAIIKKLIENQLSSTLAVSLGWFGNAEFSSLVKTENSYIKYNSFKIVMQYNWWVMRGGRNLCH